MLDNEHPHPITDPIVKGAVELGDDLWETITAHPVKYSIFGAIAVCFIKAVWDEKWYCKPY